MNFQQLLLQSPVSRDPLEIIRTFLTMWKFTIIFAQFDASLINKSINLFKETTLLAPNVF